MARITNTARGLVISDGKILLMKRYNGGQHYFSIPGGGIEPGETREETVEREIAEETSTKVHVRRLVLELKVKGSTHSIFLCDYLSGEPSLQPDSEEAKITTENNTFEPVWQPTRDFANLYLRFWEPLKPFITKGLREGFPEKPEVVDV